MVVTATGWVMYGSPLLRICPRWARSATVKARSMSVVSARGSLDRSAWSTGSIAGETAARDPRSPKRDRTRGVRASVVAPVTVSSDITPF